MNENVLFFWQDNKRLYSKETYCFLIFPDASTYSTNSWSRKLLVVGSRLKQTIKQ